jgi:hypothetical protein
MTYRSEFEFSSLTTPNLADHFGETDRKEREDTMRKVTLVVLTAAVLFAPAAYAQMMEQTSQPGSEQMSTDGSGQSMVAVEGKIKVVDLSRGTLTLEDGTQFTLPPSFQYTSFPAIGEQVQVTYAREGEQKVIRAIDITTGGDSDTGGGG